MTWVFVGAYVLLLFAFIGAMIFGDTGGEPGQTTGGFFIMVVFAVVSLGVFNIATTVERDCYHAGGDVVNTQCVVIGEKLLLNDEAEDR